MFHSPPRIIVIAGFHWEPRRVHPAPKRQERAAYHRRIQKKWVKRFGLRCVDDLPRGKTIVDTVANTITCRREDAPIVKQQLRPSNYVWAEQLEEYRCSD